MPLDDQHGRWIQCASYVRDTVEPFLSSMPQHGRVLPSTLSGLQAVLGEYLHTGNADTPPEGSPLAAATAPLVTALREFTSITKAPTDISDLRDLLCTVRDATRITHLALTSDGQLAVQTVDEVIADFAQEYRISLILALTANYALSQNVSQWQESKSSGRTTGDHLDLNSMKFVQEANDRTIPMSALTAASIAEPLVITAQNFAASMQDLMTGGTPPPLYRMAYTQWFTNIHAAWEDTYRPRLAAAHGTDDTGTSWAKNDIRSEFFNEVRQIRHDISHKRGMCVESAGNTIIDWLEAGNPIAPTPRQMIGLLDQFPHDELRRTPTRVTRTNSPLPYQFPNEWIERVKAHVEAIEPVKKKRPAVLQEVIDQWLDPTTTE